MTNKKAHIVAQMAEQPFLARNKLPEIRQREVLRVAGVLSGEDSDSVFSDALKEVLRWAKRRAGQPLPSSAWNGESFEMQISGRDPSAVRLRSNEYDFWALRIHDPDKTMPGRTWTTEVVLGLKNGEPVRFSVLLLMASPEKGIQFAPAVPGLVQQIAEKCGIVIGTQIVSAAPAFFTSRDDAERLIEHLIDPGRRLPSIVLTTPNKHSVPLIDADDLANTLKGIAHVAVVHPPAYWRVKKLLGKSRSVFNGAVRVYRSGFDETANPYAHRLFLASELTSDQSVEYTTQWLREFAAKASLQETRLGGDVLTFAMVQSGLRETQLSRMRKRNTSEAKQLSAARKHIEELKNETERLNGELGDSLEEWEKDRKRAENAEAQIQTLDHRIKQLGKYMKSIGIDPDQDIFPPTKWEEFADWCDENLSGRLVLGPIARRNTRKPHYNDIKLAAESLMWLSNKGREIFIHGGTKLANKRISKGAQNAPCGSDEFNFEWSGRKFTADWHVKAGGNSRAPERCMRIYYCFDKETQQIIVADMPAHRKNSIS